MTTVYLLVNPDVVRCSRCKEPACADWEVREGERRRYYCGYCLVKRNLGDLTNTAINRATMKWRMAHVD